MQEVCSTSVCNLVKAVSQPFASYIPFSTQMSFSPYPTLPLVPSRREKCSMDERVGLNSAPLTTAWPVLGWSLHSAFMHTSHHPLSRRCFVFILGQNSARVSFCILVPALRCAYAAGSESQCYSTLRACTALRTSIRSAQSRRRPEGGAAAGMLSTSTPPFIYHGCLRDHRVTVLPALHGALWPCAAFSL